MYKYIPVYITMNDAYTGTFAVIITPHHAGRGSSDPMLTARAAAAGHLLVSNHYSQPRPYSWRYRHEYYPLRQRKHIYTALYIQRSKAVHVYINTVYSHQSPAGEPRAAGKVARGRHLALVATQQPPCATVSPPARRSTHSQGNAAAVFPSSLLHGGGTTLLTAR